MFEHFFKKHFLFLYIFGKGVGWAEAAYAPSPRPLKIEQCFLFFLINFIPYINFIFIRIRVCQFDTQSTEQTVAFDTLKMSEYGHIVVLASAPKRDAVKIFCCGGKSLFQKICLITPYDFRPKQTSVTKLNMNTELKISVHYIDIDNAYFRLNSFG